MAKRLWTVGICMGCTVCLYAMAPFVAGVIGIGNRWGPRIYPLAYHEVVYMLGWDFGSHEAVKPRIAMGMRPEWRPWFYGLSSRNDRVPCGGTTGSAPPTK